MIFRDRILNKINNSIKDTIDYSKIRYISFDEEGVVAEVNSSIITATGFFRISSEECVIISEKYLGIVSVIKDSTTKIILLDKTQDIKVGDKIRRTMKPLMIPVNETLIGRVIDGLCRPLDNKSPIIPVKRLPVERPAVDIIDRKLVKDPLQTGIKAIDSLIPIGRGQRELILGDRQTGKTSLAIDTIINQKDQNVICIYCSIGQKDSSLVNTLNILQEHNAMKYTIVMQASSSEIAGHQYIAPYSATSISEYFMEQGKDVLIVYDDLTKHARAYREISLLLEKNPGREAYPADIFYVHSRLLERSANISDELGGGSITSLPIIETEAENISAYIPTNVISITDGQIYLSPTLFQKGILPAIDIGKSISRVGSSAQLPAYKQTTGILGIEYSQFEELESFSKLTTTLDESSEKIINRGLRIREFLKQDVNETLGAAQQIAILACLNAGLLDKIPLENIKESEKIIIKILNDNFENIINIVRKKEKIPQDILDLFLSKVKNNLNS